MIHTNSSIAKFNRCKREFKYAYIDLVRPRGSGKALHVGTLFHRGCELLWGGTGIAETIAILDKEKDDFFSTEKGQFEWQRVKAIVGAYWHNNASEFGEWEVVSLEETFSIEVSGMQLSGKFDGLVRSKKGELFVLEHKTTSEKIESSADPYWTKLALDRQILIYQMAAEQMYGEQVGVLYDVVKKPAGKPRPGPSKPKKGETQEQFEARKAEMMETPEQFGARMLDDMLDNLSKHFSRRAVYRERYDTDLLRTELFESMDAIESYRGTYPRNSDACMAKYGVCPYMSVCTGSGSLSDPMFEKLPAPHQELDLSLAIETQEDANDCPI